MPRTRLGLICLAAVALAWRLAVLSDLRRSPLLEDAATAAEVNLVLATSWMGLAFLACGALVLARTRNKRSAVFALYAICAAFHWGGPLHAADEQLQQAIWMLYFLVSAMLAQAAFLHFTLVFPEPWSWASRHATRLVIYFPVALGLVAGAMAVAAAPDSSGEAWQHKFLILESLQANLFAAAGLIILVIRCLRARPVDGPRSITGPMAIGAWLSVLPWVAAMALEAQGVAVPGGASAYTLLFVVAPLVFTWAILRHRPAVSVAEA